MIRYERSLRVFAICLATLAGFVDAIGFMSLGGFFLSFMSGNSTRLSVGLAGRSHHAAIAGGLIACFVLGVFLGSAFGRGWDRRRRPAAILVLVCGLLACGSSLAVLGFKPLALALVAMSMGAVNTIFEREGEVSIGVTYMTGTLVKLGQRAAAAFFGGGRWEWVPYFLLWLGLVVGAFLGSACYSILGLQTLWIAVAMGLVLAFASTRLDFTASS